MNTIYIRPGGPRTATDVRRAWIADIHLHEGSVRPEGHDVPPHLPDLQEPSEPSRVLGQLRARLLVPRLLAGDAQHPEPVLLGEPSPLPPVYVDDVPTQSPLVSQEVPGPGLRLEDTPRCDVVPPARPGPVRTLGDDDRYPVGPLPVPEQVLEGSPTRLTDGPRGTSVCDQVPGNSGSRRTRTCESPYPRRPGCRGTPTVLVPRGVTARVSRATGSVPYPARTGPDPSSRRLLLPQSPSGPGRSCVVTVGRSNLPV